MTRAKQTLLLVDPLTLTGQELGRALSDPSELALELRAVHTRDDDEQQIVELSGQTALAPPLRRADELEGCAAIVVTSDTDSPHHEQVEDFARANPEVPLVDLSRLARFAAMTSPAAGRPALRPSPPHVRVAHPALVAAVGLTAAIAHLDPAWASLTAVDPVSAFGRDAIEGLARQAARRLQGDPVEELIRGEVLAFNLIARRTDRLAEEAAALLPGIPTTVSLTQSGTFHGHLLNLTMGLAAEIDESDLLDAWAATTSIVVEGPPLRLDVVTQTDTIWVTRPQLARDHRSFSVIAMLDGLRVGGALTAIEILKALL